jgi:hypothetical protein
VASRPPRQPRRRMRSGSVQAARSARRAHAPGREPSSHSGASCRAKAQHCCEPGSPRPTAHSAAPC